MDPALALVAALWLLVIRKPDKSPAPPPPGDTLTREADALSRGLASEASAPKYSDAERRGVAWAIRNKADRSRDGRGIWELGGAGSWGKQGDRGAAGIRSYSTAREASAADRALAIQVLSESPESDPTRGAVSFFEPAVQDYAFRQAEKYRSDPGRYPDLARFALYKSDAAGIRDRWARGGIELLIVIGRWEFWG